MAERLPEEARAWVRRSLARDAAIVHVERLRSGTSSAVHGITVRTGGRSVRVVVKRYVDPRIRARHPHYAQREADVLSRVERCAVSTPAVIAVDPDGSAAGAPALLTRRLSGRLDVTPTDPKTWRRALAATLAAIHELSPAGLPRYHPWSDLKGWVPLPGWERLADLAAAAPRTSAVLVHRDFQPYNVLWSRGRITGVTDWVNACSGPAGTDVAHCAVNIAALFGRSAAFAFVGDYSELSGRAVHAGHLARGVIGATGLADGVPFQARDAGHQTITAHQVHRRLHAYATALALVEPDFSTTTAGDSHLST